MLPSTDLSLTSNVILSLLSIDFGYPNPSPKQSIVFLFSISRNLRFAWFIAFPPTPCTTVRWLTLGKSKYRLVSITSHRQTLDIIRKTPQEQSGRLLTLLYVCVCVCVFFATFQNMLCAHISLTFLPLKTTNDVSSDIEDLCFQPPSSPQALPRTVMLRTIVAAFDGCPRVWLETLFLSLFPTAHTPFPSSLLSRIILLLHGFFVR